MKAIYTISENDYVAAMKLFTKPTGRHLLIYIIVIAILLLIAFIGSQGIRGGIIGGLIGAFIVVFVMRVFGNPIITRRQYRKFAAIKEPIEIELLESGVKFDTVDSSGILRWGKMLKWRQNGEFVLVYQAPRLYHVIPKAIDGKGFDIDKLIHRLTAHLGNET